MKKRFLSNAFATTFLALTLGLGFYGVSNADSHEGSSWKRLFHFWDDDDDDDHHHRSRVSASAQNPLYQSECGSCHMAYPASFLPEQSWQKIMTGLDDHFGDNAELDEQTQKEIETYLVTTSKRDHRFSKLRHSRYNEDQTPLRITELNYFVHEHDEIPAGIVGKDAKVKSFSQCQQCHQNAEIGDFDEDNVVVPGIGRWDD